MKTIKPNKGCKTLLGIGSPLKFTQNDEHDIVKQAMECLNNFNRKSAGYQLGLIEGYAKALNDVEKIIENCDVESCCHGINMQWLKNEIAKLEKK